MRPGFCDQKPGRTIMPGGQYQLIADGDECALLRIWMPERSADDGCLRRGVFRLEGCGENRLHADHSTLIFMILVSVFSL